MCIRDRANVSHELRTPLTAIQGYADTLLDVDDAPETRRKFINIIRKHASRMVRLVEDLLTLSRLENGEGMSEGEECAPDDALELSLIHISLTRVSQRVAPRASDASRNESGTACMASSATLQMVGTLINASMREALNRLRPV